MPTRTRSSAMRTPQACAPRRQAKRHAEATRLVVCRMRLWTPTPATPSPSAPFAAADHVRRAFDPLTVAVLAPHPTAARVLPITPWWREAVATAARPPAAITLPWHITATPSPAAPLPADGKPALSTREWEVFALLAAGLTNNAIAHELTIAPSTVKWYIKQIFAKLGVHSRTQAVARLPHILGNMNP